MRIAIISTFDVSGGAARATYRLHRGLTALGHESIMLVKVKLSQDPGVIQATDAGKESMAREQIINVTQEHWINHNRTPLSNTMFSLPYPGCDLHGAEPLMKAEVLNLHWIARYQSVETVAMLLRSGSPVVWTLHDQWAFTGGCHYSAGCSKYRCDCRDCPQLADNRFQVPFHVLNHRVEHLSHALTVVTPSKWLADCASQSKVFENCRIEVIANSLDTESFKPRPKTVSKRSLGIAPHTVTLLFGAWELAERRKGFDLLLQSVKFCLEYPSVKDLAAQGRLKVLTFGIPDTELRELGIDILNLGKITSDEELSAAYSASDLFVLPSREDNLPNTILEAMSCGTPVVSFRVGGIPDMIEDGRTGYLAQPGDSREMGSLIAKLVLDEGLRLTMSGQSRSVAERRYRLEVQAGRYIELFQDLITERSKKGKSPGTFSRDESRDSGQADTLEEEIPTVDRHLAPLYQQCAVEALIQRNEEIGRLSSEIQEAHSAIEELRGDIGGKAKLINWLRSDIETKESYIAAFKQLVEERDRWIDELKAYIETKDHMVQERNDWIVWLKGEIRERELQIQERAEQLNALVNSRAYKTGTKVLLPITTLLNFLKKHSSF